MHEEDDAAARLPLPRIAIDARPLAGPPCGYTVYICSLLAALRARGFGVTLISNRPIRDDYGEAVGLDCQVFGRTSEIGWEQRDLPDHLATAAYDVFVNAANRGTPIRKNPRTRYILGLLDVIPYIFVRQYFAPCRVIKNRSLVLETISQLIAIARADAILTISQQSANDIRRIFRRRAVTDRLIRLPALPSMETRPTKRQFVYVGGSDFRKRIDMLLRAFAMVSCRHPDCRLVLVGWNYDSIRPLVRELMLEDRVTITGYVDEGAKMAILAESVAMVYPSLYEGYGLAIAEGFQAGIPVIAGVGGSQRQIGGDGVRLIDPLDPDAIAAAMEDMLDPDVRSQWVVRGQAQLRRLTDPAIESDLADYFLNQGRLARQQHR